MKGNIEQEFKKTLRLNTTVVVLLYMMPPKSYTTSTVYLMSTNHGSANSRHQQLFTIGVGIAMVYGVATTGLAYPMKNPDNLPFGTFKTEQISIEGAVQLFQPPVNHLYSVH
jgi:hypothetical protein